MNILIGLLLTVLVGSLFVAMVGMFADKDWLVMPGLGVFGVSAVILALGFIWALVLGGGGPHIVAGHCYQAYKHGSYVPITYSTGKSVVVIPTYVEGIDLAEMECPR